MEKLDKAFFSATREGRAKNLRQQYLAYARKHGYDTSKTISAEWILKNILGEGCSCHYCGTRAWKYLGADRDDSFAGHTEENSICCCEECNAGKREYGKEDFEKISEIKIYTSKTKKKMETYTITRVEEYMSIKNDYNREIDRAHVEDIKKAMVAELRKGMVSMDRLIQVESVTYQCLSGGHRLCSGKELAIKDGIIYPLEVALVDLGGNPTRIEDYIAEMEAHRDPWHIKEHIEHYRNTDEYKKLREFMKANGINSYKPIQWAFGLTVQKVRNTKLKFSDIDYKVAEETFDWVRRALATVNEDAYTGTNTKVLAYERNLTTAIRNILYGRERGSLKASSVSQTNQHIYDINEFSAKFEDGLLVFADIFSDIEKDAKKRMEEQYGKGKTINATVWVESFYCLRQKAQQKREKANKRTTLDRPKYRLIAE